MSPHQPQPSTNQINRFNVLWELQPTGVDRGWTATYNVKGAGVARYQAIMGPSGMNCRAGCNRASPESACHNKAGVFLSKGQLVGATAQCRTPRLLQEVLQPLHIRQQRLNLPPWHRTAAPQISGDLSIKGQAHQPSVAQGMMRHQARLLRQALVHLDDLAGHRAVHLPHRLHRLQGGHGVHDLVRSCAIRTICHESDLQMVGISCWFRSGRFMARSWVRSHFAVRSGFYTACFCCRKVYHGSKTS